MLHELKTDSDVFQAVIEGKKNFEIRLDDRHFAVGDTLHLLETVSTGAEMLAGAVLEYTGGDHLAVITYILRGPVYGLQAGWAILSIEDMPSTFNPAADLLTQQAARIAELERDAARLRELLEMTRFYVRVGTDDRKAIDALLNEGGKANG